MDMIDGSHQLEIREKNINILTVGVVIGNIAIPIAWKVLPQSTKRGNSNTKHRVELFTEVLGMMPAAEIRLLAMDREFAGREWLQWLHAINIASIARIKENTLVHGRRADSYRATRRAKTASARATVFNLDVHFAGKTIQRNGRRDERLYVVSNRFGRK